MAPVWSRLLYGPLEGFERRRGRFAHSAQPERSCEFCLEAQKGFERKGSSPEGLLAERADELVVGQSRRGLKERTRVELDQAGLAARPPKGFALTEPEEPPEGEGPGVSADSPDDK